MTISRTATGTAQNVASGLTGTIPITTTGTGKTMILGARIGGTSQTVSVADDKGNSWSIDTGPTWLASFGSVIIAHALITTAGATNVTITLGSSATTMRTNAYEYSGLDTVNPFVTAIQANGASGTALSSGNMSTTADGILVFGFAGNNGTSSDFTAGTNFSLIEGIPSAANTQRAASEEWFIQTGAAAGSPYAATMTKALSTDAWIMAGAIFKAPSTDVLLAQICI